MGVDSTAKNQIRQAVACGKEAILAAREEPHESIHLSKFTVVFDLRVASVGAAEILNLLITLLLTLLSLPPPFLRLS